MFSADNAGRNQLIFAFATRFVAAAPFEKIYSDFFFNTDGDSISRYTGDLPAERRIIVASASIFRSYEEEGMPFAVVFPCSSIVLRLALFPLTDCLRRVYKWNFPKI